MRRRPPTAPDREAVQVRGGDRRFDHRDRQRMAARGAADDADLRAGRAVAGVIGGTNSCANADGRAVTTDAKGALQQEAAGRRAAQALSLRGARGRPSPGAKADGRRDLHGGRARGRAAARRRTGGGRLVVLTDTRLDGSSGLLTWFGAPPAAHPRLHRRQPRHRPRQGPRLPGRHRPRRVRPAVGGTAVARHDRARPQGADRAARSS